MANGQRIRELTAVVQEHYGYPVKRKSVADGVSYAELYELLLRTLAEDGYARVEVRMTPILTEIIIRATRLREVLVDKGRRIHELTAVVQ